MDAATLKPIHKWYVLRTFSGHEKKVKEYLEQELDRAERTVTPTHIAAAGVREVLEALVGCRGDNPGAKFTRPAAIE